MVSTDKLDEIKLIKSIKLWHSNDFTSVKVDPILEKQPSSPEILVFSNQILMSNLKVRDTLSDCLLRWRKQKMKLICYTKSLYSSSFWAQYFKHNIHSTQLQEASLLCNLNTKLTFYDGICRSALQNGEVN